MREKNIYSVLEDDSPIIIMNGTKTYPDPNFFYFSGARFGGFENCALVVEKSGSKILTMELEADAARDTDCEVLVWKSGKEREEMIRTQLKDADKIYVNASKLNAQHYNDLLKMFPDKKIEDCSEEILKARMIKDPDEIASLREICRISSRAIENAWSQVKEGMTEKDFASSLIHSLMELGSSLPQCEPTVAFGENTAFPHFQATDRKLKKGDFILADFNGLVNKYTSDLTRTVVFGKASEKQKEIHGIVKEANSIGKDAIKSGVEAREVEKKVRDYIDSTKYRGRFIHGLGHGIGLELHDHPAMGLNSSIVLRTNMAVTVEPGIYIPGFGGVRIEDDVMVTDTGISVMTDTTRELVEL